MPRQPNTPCLVCGTFRYPTKGGKPMTCHDCRRKAAVQRQFTPHVRFCTQCGVPFTAPHGRRVRCFSDKCASHKGSVKASASRRGYGASHRAKRRALLPLAYGTHCDLCGDFMWQGQALDLDHSVPLGIDPTSVGDRIVHASCNRSRNVRRGRHHVTRGAG